MISSNKTMFQQSVIMQVGLRQDQLAAVDCLSSWFEIKQFKFVNIVMVIESVFRAYKCP